MAQGELRQLGLDPKIVLDALEKRVADLLA
jgi:hypothetical protein